MEIHPKSLLNADYDKNLYVLEGNNYFYTNLHCVLLQIRSMPCSIKSKKHLANVLFSQIC